jgi:hypothetical protein
MNESITSEDFDSDFDQHFDQSFDRNLDNEFDKDTVEATPADELWSYEVPRPWLSIEEAASMLGRSVRGVERSIIGRWGNKLPEGWQARRVRLDGKDEWRIVPPPGFRVKHSKKMDPATRAALARSEHERNNQESLLREHQQELEQSHLQGGLSDRAKVAADLEHSFESSGMASGAAYSEKSEGSGTGSDLGAGAASSSSPFKGQANQGNYDYLHEDNDVPSKTAEGQSGFSLEKLFQSASQMAQKELASIGLNVKNQLMVDSQNYSNSLDVEHTIVIDRSDEVEKLLRELANVQKELSEERRQHMDDMRLINQMQNNMRLLEVNATQTSELKDDLKMAQKLLSEHKKQYQAYLALPWWKTLFMSQP